MKKLVLAIAVLCLSTTIYAQRSNINSANNSLKYKEYKKAIEYIDEAVKDPSTKDDPKAWFTRGNIYMAMQQDPGYKDEAPYKEGVKSYMKVIELDPDYKASDINNALLYSAYQYYNEAIMAYNSKKFGDAIELAEMTVNIHDLNGGKRFSNPGFDTLAAGAMAIRGLSAYYGDQKDLALEILSKVKDNPIESKPTIYLLIADLHRKAGNSDKEIAIIEEARTKFPDDANIRNEELNYYVINNKQAELVEKLKAAVASDPDNPIYNYNLANVYSNMAFGKEDGVPENYEELVKNSEAGFKKALASDPDNAGYNYDLGALYFNKASKVTDKMMKITGTTAEDDKLYNTLKKERDAYFAQALPYLENVYNTFEPKLSELGPSDKSLFISAATAMREIYARQNQLEKAAELKKKLEQM